MWAAAFLLLLGFNKGVAAFSSCDGHGGSRLNTADRRK